MRRRTALAIGLTATGGAALGYATFQADEDGNDRSGWHRPGEDDAVLINRRLSSVGLGEELALPFSSMGYAIKTPLRIPRGVTLVCDPRSPIRAAADLKFMVSFQASDGRLVGATLESGSRTVGTMVSIAASSRNVSVVKCYLRAGDKTGIGVRAHGDQIGTSVSDCLIEGPATGVSFVGSGRGLRVVGTKIMHWQQRGLYVQQRGSGPYVDITIRDNTVGDMGEGGVSRYPIVVTGTESNKTRKLVVRGNTVTGANRSWRDPKAPGTADQIAVRHARTVDVSDNVSSGGGDVGITVAHCHNGTVSNNRVSENDTAGIYVGTRKGFSMGKVVVEGNYCENNGQNRQGDRRSHGRAGIRVAEGGRVIVRNNTLLDTQLHRTQLAGITLDGTPEVTLEGNFFRGIKTQIVRTEK